MHFRRTPHRVLAARLAFQDEAVRLLPHLARAAAPLPDASFAGVECTESEIVERAAAFELFSGAERALYGESFIETRFLESRMYGRDPRAELSVLGAPARRARARAAALSDLAAHRPLSADMPDEVRCDGEISKRVAAVLVARRKAWEAAGRPLAEAAWRTLDLSSATVSLALPAGSFRLFRDAVVGDAVPAEFHRLVVLDESLAARGGLFRAEVGDDGLHRIVALGRRVGVLTVARVLVREHGKFFAPEIFRRLRSGASVTFAPSRNRFGKSRTAVTLSGGTKDRAAIARLKAQADRLGTLADAHDKAVARYAEIGRSAAVAFSGKGEIRSSEVQARLAHAMRDFASARDRYNTQAAELCLKSDLAEHPYEAPPGRMPRPRASLCKGDQRSISRAEASFIEAWTELRAARSAHESAFGPTMLASREEPAEAFSLEYA